MFITSIWGNNKTQAIKPSSLEGQQINTFAPTAIDNFNIHTSMSANGNADSFQGMYVSPWYEAKGNIVVLVNGWLKTNPDLSVYIEETVDGQSVKEYCTIKTKDNLYSEWDINIGNVTVPFRIVAIDNTTAGDGWVSVSDPHTPRKIAVLESMLSFLFGAAGFLILLIFSILLIKNKRIYKFNSCLFLLLTLIFGFVLLEIKPSYNVANLFLLIQEILTLMISGMLIVLCVLRLKSKYDNNSANFLGYTIILCFGSLFLGSAIISHHVINNYNFFTKFSIISLFLSTIVFMFAYFRDQFFINWQNKLGHKKIGLFTANAYLFYILILLYIIVRFRFLNAMPKYDGLIYSTGLLDVIPTFNFTLTSLFSNFALFNHTSIGYIMIMAIGQYFSFGNNYLINIEDMLLNILGIFAFYKIGKHFFSESKFNAEVLIATFIFAFTPQFFGQSLTMDNDFPTLVFFVCMIAAYLYDQKVLFILSSLLLIFSKETGIMLYVAFVFSLFVVIFFINIKRTSIFDTMINNFHLFVSGVFFALYYVFRGGQMWVSLDDSSSQFFIFRQFITRILSVMFLSNFKWVTLLIIVISLIIMIFKYKKKFKMSGLIKEFPIIIPLIFTYLLYTIFFCFFNTNVHPRYYVGVEFFLCFFLMFLLVKSNIFKKIRITVLIAVASLYFLSIFYTFDPLMFMNYKSFDFSNKKIVMMGRPGAEFICDDIVYNSQYTQITFALNDIFKGIKVEPDTKLVFLDCVKNWTVGLDAFGATKIYIDTDTSELTLSPDHSFVPTVYYYNDGADFSQLKDLGECYAIYIDWNGIDEQKALNNYQQYFKIDNTQTVDYYGYIMKAYKMVPLNNS
jgi:hypothetical protein